MLWKPMIVKLTADQVEPLYYSHTERLDSTNVCNWKWQGRHYYWIDGNWRSGLCNEEEGRANILEQACMHIVNLLTSCTSPCVNYYSQPNTAWQAWGKWAFGGRNWHFESQFCMTKNCVWFIIYYSLLSNLVLAMMLIVWLWRRTFCMLLAVMEVWRHWSISLTTLLPCYLMIWKNYSWQLMRYDN